MFSQTSFLNQYIYPYFFLGHYIIFKYWLWAPENSHCFWKKSSWFSSMISYETKCPDYTHTYVFLDSCVIMLAYLSGYRFSGQGMQSKQSKFQEYFYYFIAKQYNSRSWISRAIMLCLSILKLHHFMMIRRQTLTKRSSCSWPTIIWILM